MCEKTRVTVNSLLTGEIRKAITGVLKEHEAHGHDRSALTSEKLIGDLVKAVMGVKLEFENSHGPTGAGEGV